MTGALSSRLGALAAGILVAGALAYLQILNAEKELFSGLCAYAAIAVVALISVLNRRIATGPNLLCLSGALIFCLWIVARGLTSPVAYVARPDLYCVLGSLTLYGVVITAFGAPSRRIALLVALLLFAIIHVLISVVQFGFGTNYDLLFPSLANVAHSSRGAGLFVDPDHLAGLLEILGVLGLSITAWSRRPGWVRVIVGYLTAACYLGLALTGSRGGYVSATVSLLTFCILSFLTMRVAGTARLVKFGGVGLAFVVAVIAVGWLFFQQNAPLQERINTIATIDRGRFDLWHAAIDQWKLSPVVGTGSGTYLFYGRQFRSPQMQEDPVDVHNDYLHLLCEYGLIGAAAFVFFFVVHIRHGLTAFARLGPARVAAGSTLRSDRLALNIGALSAVAAYVVHSTVDFNLHIPANALLLAFVFGIIADPGLEFGGRATSPRFVKIGLAALATILLLQCARLLPGEYYAEHARAALRDDDPATAVQFAGQALAHEKQNPNIYFYLGRALLSLGSEDDHAAERPALYDRALQAFDEARRVAPLDGTYPLEMARTFDRLGRFAEAEKMFALARERDPRSDAVAQLYAAHLEMQANRPNE
ncbi:MAG: O-antigen ligase family protein [Chthoniobacterales bacterium]